MADISLPPVTVGTAIAKDTDVLVVGLAEASGSDVLVGLGEDWGSLLDAAFGAEPVAVVTGIGASSKNSATALLPAPRGQRLVVVGLGNIDVTAEQVRRATGSALRVVAGLKGERPLKVAVSLDAVEPTVIKGAVEGALLGSVEAGITSKGRAGIAAIQIVTSNKRPDARHAVELGVTTASAVHQARAWVNDSPAELYPDSFAEQIRARAKGSKVTVEVWDEKALEKDGCGGILAVGSGSTRKPRLAKVSYAPRGARFHLSLVGKGITFDSGGLDLKPPDSMYTMKSDMAGAAAVVAAVEAIAALGLRIKVTGWAPLAENLPSGSAYRPSDVLTIHGGTTVENGNTDAEGRLVLADALVLAGEEEPQLIVDVATLTGACIVALGERVSGLMARDDETADLILDAAEAAGELFWQLPIPEEARGKLDSSVADLKSTGDRAGGALSAAAFLSEFVPTEIAWAHLDIAGPSFNTSKPYHYVPTGGTGVAVRTLIALAHALAS